MEIKVNLTREEVSSHFKQSMKATTPDGCWHFGLKFSENELESMEDEIKAKLDIREYKDVSASFPFLNQRIFKKMKIDPSNVATCDPAQLNLLPEVIIAFRNKVCDLMGLASYKPSQQVLPGDED